MLSLKDFFLKLIQGIVIGIGAVLPGISGGVLSVVFGVYQPIMEFLADPVSCLKTHLPVLFPVFLGYGIGFLGVANLLAFLLEKHSAFSICFFLGLIFGTVPSLIASCILRSFSNCSFSFSSGQGTGRRKGQHLLFLLVHADCICPALSPKNHVCPDPPGNPCILLLRLLPGSQHHRPRNELFCPFNASWPVHAFSLWNRTSVSCCPDSRRDQRSFHHHSPVKSDQLPVSPSL